MAKTQPGRGARRVKTTAAADTPAAGVHASDAPGKGRLLAMLALVAAIGLAAWWWFRTPTFTIGVDADRNVLLVTIDTLRADALGSYGGRATTPNLDRLAARGARFASAHAHAVVTLPSHTSILTGRYPYEHGIRDNTGYRLPPATQTAATRLKAMGFATGAFVGGFPLDRRFGLAAGFDVYDDRMSPASLTADAGERERRADAVVNSALEWMSRQTGKWFAWVHVYDPHVVYEAPPEWAARFPNDPYLAEVSWTDAALGPLLDQLAAQSRSTLVIVTADHGESLGSHGELTHSVFAYEPVLRVPLIVSEEGDGTAAGREGVTVTAPVRHVDLLPTIMDALGGAAEDSASGRSLRPLIAGRADEDRPSYFEAMTPTLARGWAPLRGVVVGHEKYIDLPIRELYDLATDPGEVTNLVPRQPERTQVLFNTLRAFNIAPPGRPQAETPETVERLRSLGYIGGGSATARETYTEDDDPKRLIEIEQIMTQAGDLQRQGRFADAVALYQKVIARRADTEDAYRKLALVYWRTGRPADAIATLETALRNGVTQSEVRIKLGQYLAQSGQPRKAIDLLESFPGDDPDALISLGNAYQLAGRSEDAVRTFLRLLAVDPQNGLAHENIGVMELQMKNFASAELSLRRAIDLDPSLSGAHTALGVVYANTGRPAEAIDAWKRAVDVDAAAFDALFNLTVGLAAAGRRDEARTYGERYVATAPPALRADIAAIQQVLNDIRRGRL